MFDGDEQRAGWNVQLDNLHQEPASGTNGAGVEKESIR